MDGRAAPRSRCGNLGFRVGGFGVWGLGFRVGGFGVWGLGFRVGGFRVWGLGFRVKQPQGLFLLNDLRTTGGCIDFGVPLYIP